MFLEKEMCIRDRCAARHASINPSYLTEGYKSTGNNQTTGKNPKVHKGFSPYLACVNKAPKVDIRFFRQEGFSLNEETWVRDIKEKREIYGISQQKLALAAGITRPYLSDIETGKAHPSEALQEAITEALERFNPDNPLEMLFDYVRTVSYTHLDVYKRQGHCLLPLLNSYCRVYFLGTGKSGL